MKILGSRTRFLGACLACYLGIHVSPVLAQDHPPASGRQSIPLDGTWELSLDGGREYFSVEVPAAVEDSRWDFDGLALYRRRVPAQACSSNQRLFLRFEAAATHCRVLVDGQLRGEHLGGWTPFEIELTDLARARPLPAEWLIQVEADERVGHNTQGFLPIVIPHFGGIWQSVSWIRTPRQRLDGNYLLATTAAREGYLTLRVVGDLGAVEEGETLEVALRSSRDQDFQVLEDFLLSDLGTADSNRGTINAPWQLEIPTKLLEWTPADPVVYRVRIRLKSARGDLLDEIQSPVCNRRISADGSRLQINGQPLVVRGVLNWGYAPPGFAPSIDEDWMRREIEFARQRGFNLMKFCLWIPPRRYLELCDELGMLAWVEYPTWHPQLDQDHLPELKQEYDEFFRHDRNHPSVILRSLTCETGPSADLQVIRSLYEQCKLAIPGALVEDDSSWISWNRVHDFYDDHPYGNNHTWVSTLAGLKAYIAEHGEKPLVLGEAIAADTFTPPGQHGFAAALPQLKTDSAPGNPHRPWFDQQNAAWLDRMAGLAEKTGQSIDLSRLPGLSRHYALLMRKFQIEAYRREVPSGGYVVSVIRDFPKAAMGLIDYQNVPKDSPQAWEFQADGMVLLRTPGDRRAAWSGSVFPVELVAANSGPRATMPGILKAALLNSETGEELSKFQFEVPAVPFDKPHSASLDTLKMPEVARPTRLILATEWIAGTLPAATNRWPLWVFPETGPAAFRLEAHPGHPFPDGWPPNFTSSNDREQPIVRVARGLDPDLLSFLAKGGRAVLVPDGREGSFPVSQHWFLRGGPVAFELPHRPWLTRSQGNLDHDLDQVDWLTELQHFDLAGPVTPNIEHFLDEVQPRVLFWDNHDQAEVRTHAAAFTMRVGAGRMLVTLLNHADSENAAGRWLLKTWFDELLDPPADDSVDLFPRLQADLNRQGQILHERLWKFRPDPQAIGHSEGWFRPEFDDSQWPRIRGDRHWEGQGYQDLDHWGWYRLNIELPANWQGPCFLNLTGVDDYADLFVNGQKVGSLGDREQRTTGFDQRRSFDVTELVRPGENVLIAIGVYDWFGAGGLFQPMTLSASPLTESPPILK